MSSCNGVISQSRRGVWNKKALLAGSKWYFHDDRLSFLFVYSVNECVQFTCLAAAKMPRRGCLFYAFCSVLNMNIPGCLFRRFSAQKTFGMCPASRVDELL